jgi:hypothetical protein
MTLKMTKEEKEARFKAYDAKYSKMYYNEQKAENTERYQDTLKKARERYYKKKIEANPEAEIKKYKKRDIMAQLEEPINVN